MKKIFTSAAFEPFHEQLFSILWLCAFVSNIGTWMQNVGVSWVAATLSASPLMISLIQTASSLPSLLFSYPAGVISDQSDRRKLLLWLQGFLFLIVLVLTVLTMVGLLNLGSLLLFTFLIGIGSAFTTPVWQAITPEVVSKPRLKAAIALNGVNFNLARAVGPALGGVILAIGGIKSVFLLNAASFLVLMLGIYRWKNKAPTVQRTDLRRSALDGLRAVGHSRPFLHVLARTVGFTCFVSILFALLPRLSKYEWNQDSAQYTWLWVCIGLGAMVGSYFYSNWSRHLRASKLVFFSCLDVAVCIFLLTVTRTSYWLDLFMFIAGMGWITATSTLNILAQEHAPDAYRGRFLAVNVTVFQGCIAL